MRECPKCLHLNPPSAKFCNNCGVALNEQVVQAVTSNKSKRAAERRQLTILFCDLVGSTPLSEQLDPEEYRQIIIDYHQLAEKVIQQFGGYVAQYLGDGLLVYFGYPKGLEDAPRSAVRAGLGILDAVEKANTAWKQAGKTAIAVRIGIHSGLVVVDDHLALGETVNVAARLEGLAPHNGLVISPQTLKLTKGWFSTNSLGLHTLKGISKPMEVFQVLQESDAKTKLDIAKSQGLSPLVGRTKEIGLLTKAWQEAKEGNGNLCLLKGEAGIGKSRLVDKMEQQIGQESASLIIEARCSAYHQQSAFYPFIQLLEKDILRFNQQDTQTAKLTKLENLVLQAGLNFKLTMRLLAEFLSIESDQFPPLAISPLAKKQRTTESLNQLIFQHATLQPILLVVEDLHWADASSLEWLQQFLEKISTHSIFLLCTTRPEYQPPWTIQSEVQELILNRLSTENMTEICLHQTRGKALPKEILDQIAYKTEGVPLFVEELTKMNLLRWLAPSIHLPFPLPYKTRY